MHDDTELSSWSRATTLAVVARIEIGPSPELAVLLAREVRAKVEIVAALARAERRGTSEPDAWPAIVALLAAFGWRGIAPEGWGEAAPMALVWLAVLVAIFWRQGDATARA